MFIRTPQDQAAPPVLKPPIAKAAGRSPAQGLTQNPVPQGSGNSAFQQLLQATERPGQIPAPPPDCALCPRLAAYRHANQEANPTWFNAPVPSFGPSSARLLVVGMAPGVKGANRTGRPFTGDHAGILLYETLIKSGLAHGIYQADPDDGVTLENCRITNAVRCVPPANLPVPSEITTCNGFLAGELTGLPNLRAVLALGLLAHAAVLRASGLPASRVRFRHGAIHTLPDGLLLADSYHVSRYNTSTRRLTTEMFETTVAALLQRLED